MWVLYAFASAIFAGLTAILAKIGVHKVDSVVTTTLRTAVVLIFAWCVVFIVGSQTQIVELSSRTWVFLIFSGIATGASWLCYFKALQLGNVNQVTPVDKSSVLLTMLFAVILLGEPLIPLKVISMILIGVGTYMMLKTKLSSVTRAPTGKKGWLFYAVLSAIFAALVAILGKIGMEGVDSNLGTAIRTVVVLIMSCGMLLVTRKGNGVWKINRKSGLFIVLSGVATGLSWLCYFRALQEGPASVVVPIDKLSIVFTIVFSYFVLRERLTKKSMIGLIVIVLGTLLLLV